MTADFVPLREMVRRRDAAGLVAALGRRVPGEARLAALVAFALSDRPAAPEIVPGTALEAALLAQIGALHGLEAYRARHGAWPDELMPRLAGRVFDGLAEDRGPEGWSAVQWLNALLLRTIAPRSTVAVVATMRDEALGLVEWVAHYRALGIGRIFVYTNDNMDGTDGLLACLAGHGLVRLIRNDVDLRHSPQRKAYAHALQALPDLWDSEWAFFIDADEFLVPPEGQDVPGWIAGLDARTLTRPPSGVVFDWRWYVSGGRFGFEPGLVLRRFQHVRPHGGFKSLVRLADTVSMRQVHYPEVVAGGVLVDTDLREVPEAAVWRKPPASGAGGWINHYWGKSFEEFSIKKARGDTLAAYHHSEWARDFGLFVTWDGPETAATHAPPPAGLVGRVAAEHGRIMALSGVRERVAAAEAALPGMLARFDAVGELRRIYDSLRPGLDGDRSRDPDFLAIPSNTIGR